jgi:hypothetical protein
LHSFFTFNSNAYVSLKDHTNIVATITYRTYPFALANRFEVASNICFLCGRAPANADTGCLNCDFEETQEKNFIVKKRIQCLSIYDESCFADEPWELVDSLVHFCIVS